MSKKKDIPEKEPVETLEEEIQAAIDATEVVEDETEEEQSADAEGEPAENEGDSGDDSDSDAESGDAEDSESGDEQDGDEDADDNAEDESEDSGTANDGELGSEESTLEAPEHWAAADRELFNNQPKESQEWLLGRHKAMEGDYTRKSQDFATDKRQYDAISDALAPYEAEFSQAGLDKAGAVRQLASVHNALKTDGKAAILRLAETYNIDMTVEENQEYTDPALQTLKNQVADLKSQSTRQNNLAQQDKQNQLLATIQNFETETIDGALAHPHFKTLQDDITRLFNAGIAVDLPDAYKKALSMRSDLTVVKPTPVTATKEDKAQKVKKAKKAATGVKSSGATGKKRSDMSLEEEIASQFN